MVQANWQMNYVGKAAELFVVLDLMRMPLGILTGAGFIGGALSATSAAKVICSPFSVEGFPSRASVEGEHGETGLSLHRTMLSQADGGP